MLHTLKAMATALMESGKLLSYFIVKMIDHCSVSMKRFPTIHSSQANETHLLQKDIVHNNQSTKLTCSRRVHSPDFYKNQERKENIDSSKLELECFTFNDE